MKSQKLSLKFALTACTALFGVAPAFAALDVNNSFSPATRYPGEVSRFVLVLQNSSLVNSQNVQLLNALPADVFIANTPNLTNSCGGTVTATNNATNGVVSINSAIIPAGDGTNPGFCRVEVDVVATKKGTYVNAIPIGALTGVTNGISESNATAASATLAIILQDVTIGWSSDLGNSLNGYDTSVRRITITNPNPVPLSGAGFVYDLWQNSYNVRIRDDLPVSSNCGMTLTVTPRPARTSNFGPTSQLDASGGTIPANGSCEILFSIATSREPTRGLSANSLSHSLPINAIVTNEGATNSTVANSTFSTYTGTRVYKYFNGSTAASINYNSTDEADLRLDFTTYNAANVAINNLTDVMPAGMTLQSITSNSCGGTVTMSPTSELAISGGNVSAGAPNQGGVQSGSCQIVARVKIAGAGSYVNQIPAGTFNGVDEQPFTQAVLNVTGEALGISKTLTRSGSLYAGDTVNAVFTITNATSTTPVSNIRLSDDLATMGYGFRVGPAGLTNNTCGGTGVIVPDATSFQMNGIDINPSQSCSFTVQLITSADAMNTTASNSYRTNTIPANTILYDIGASTDRTFGLTVSAPIWLYPSVYLSKSFNPNVVGPLGISRLRINVQRVSNDRIGMSNISLIDNLPAGHVVAPTPNVFNGCGGTVSAAPGSGSIMLSGANMPLSATNSASCYIDVDVLAPAMTPPNTTETSTNVIPGDPRPNPRVNFIATDDRQPAPYNEVRNYRSTSANLTRRATSVTVNKEFTPSTINGGGTSRVRITFSNVEPTAINLTGVSLTDAFAGTDMRLYSNVNPTFTDLNGVPNSNGCTGGTFVGAPGGTQITLNNATIAAGRSCIMEFNVTAFRGGNHINRLFANDLISNEGVSNPSDVSATLTVGYQVGVGKGFSPSVIEAGAQSTLTLDIYNTNVAPNDQTGDSPAIIDTMPAGLQIVPGTSSTNCAGGVTSTGVDGSGNHFLRLDGGLFPASNACQVQVQVTTATTGTYLNQIPVGALRTTTGSASPDAAEALLRVVQPPVITKAFGPAAIPIGGTSTITFTISNPNVAALLPTGISGIAFSDVMTNMQVASPLIIGGTCTGVVTNASIGTTNLNLSNISVAPSAQCTVTVPVTSSTPGTLPNQTTGATSNQTTQASAPSNVAQLTVLQPVTIAKAFAEPAVAIDEPVRMTFELANPNPIATAISNPGFTDLFPTTPGAMRVAATPNLTSTCGSFVRNYGDTGNLAPGDLGVLVRGGSVPANANCQISFNVIANQPGNYVNVTSPINSAGGTSPAATAQLYVLSIAATNDSVSGINGQAGTSNALNVFNGDTLNGAAATASNTTLTVASGSAVPAELTFDTATGDVGVVAGTAAGTYSFDYRICDQGNALNCTNATASVTVAPSADLSITKTNTPGVNGEVDQASDTVTNNATTNYTIVVTNSGPDPITGALVQDTVGGGLTCPAGNPVTITGDGVPAGSFNFGDLSGTGITLGTLAVGESTTLSFACQVDSSVVPPPQP